MNYFAGLLFHKYPTYYLIDYVYITNINCSKKVWNITFALNFSHIRPLGAAGALAVDICICFHDIES